MSAPMPARIHHLLTLNVLSEQLAPTYGKAHNNTAADVLDEVREGLQHASMHVRVCEATWEALKKARPRADDGELVEKVAAAMAKGGPKPMAATGKLADGMTALLALIDVNVGRASDMARQALESEQGQVVLRKALEAAGEYMAGRLLNSARK